MTNDRNESRSPSCGDCPSCQDYEAHLSAYVLGELEVLSDDERAGLEAHLESCARCREEEALLRRTVEAVTRAGAASATGEVIHLDTSQLEAERRDMVLSEAAGAVAAESKKGSGRAATSRGSVASRRVPSGSPLARRLSWFAAAAAILACVVPFLIDSGGGSAPGVGISNVTSSAPARPERAGAPEETRPALVEATETFANDGAVSRPPARTPGVSFEVTETAAVTPPPAGSSPADFSVTEIAAGEFRSEGDWAGFRDATTLSTAPIAPPAPEPILAPEVAFRLSRSEDGVELASALGENRKAADRRRTSLEAARGLGREVDETSAATRYRTYSIEAVPGVDGITGTVDDRVLLSGGGTDGRFAGAETRAESGEVLLPPNVTSPEPVGREPVTVSAARRVTTRSKRRAEDAQAASGRAGELGTVVAGLEEQAQQVQQGETRAAPGAPLHYATNPESQSLWAEAGGAGGGQMGEARDRTIDEQRAALAGGEAAARGGRAEKPQSGEAAPGGEADYFLALNTESARPAPRSAAPSRGRARDRFGESQATGPGAGYSRATRGELAPDASAAPTEAPVDSSVRLSAKPPAMDGAEAKAGALGLGDVKQLQEQLASAGPERPGQTNAVEKLAEKESSDKGGYYSKKYDEAMKAAEEEAKRQNQAPELAKRLVESELEVADGLADADRDVTRRRTATRPVVDARKLVEEYCQRLAPRPGETPDMMFFRYWGTNPFVEASVDSQSTFAVDVDTASYTLLRKYLTDRGVLPPREAIRTEEFLNYFDYEYAPPADGEAFAVHTEMAPSPFGHEPQYQLLKIGIKGREVSSEKRQPCALVFVVDTSGSMGRESRLELVKDGLRLLVREVDEGDTIGIVAFDQAARTIIEPTPADQKEKILDAINTLQPRRNTNVDSGLTMGYQMAAASFLERGTNRVLLLSDGVANTGVTDVNGMLANVRAQRQRGIFLTCIGVGMGNHNDTLLEQLADRGDGQCVYVDRLEEAQKVFVENLAGTLETIARDVKIQVEFDREKVLRYRLLGYENRAIADSAFRDDTVDAGEVGAGHAVTAVYELKCRPDIEGRIATVRVRHLKVDSREPVELEHVVDTSKRHGAFADASPRFRLAALAGEFAEILRESYWARGSDLARVAAMTQDLLGEGGMKLGTDPEVAELAALMFRAVPLVEARRKSEGELAQVMDALKENTHLRSRVEELGAAERQDNTFYLQDLQRQNDELRRRLERLLDQRVSGGR